MLNATFCYQSRYHNSIIISVLPSDLPQNPQIPLNAPKYHYTPSHTLTCLKLPSNNFKYIQSLLNALGKSPSEIMRTLFATLHCLSPHHNFIIIYIFAILTIARKTHVEGGVSQDPVCQQPILRAKRAV